MTEQLSRQDRMLIPALRNAGVLQDLDPRLLNQEKGAIAVMCSDGDRFFDAISHHARTQAPYRPTPRIHTLAWHGGAIACAPCSPVNKTKRHADQLFIDLIADARTMKDMDLVALYGHAPCGAAYACGLPLEAVFALMMRARERVRATNHGIQTACLFHADYGEGKMKTYFFSCAQWQHWADGHEVRAIA